WANRNTSAYRIFIHGIPARKRSGIAKVTLWITKAIVLRRRRAAPSVRPSRHARSWRLLLILRNIAVYSGHKYFRFPSVRKCGYIHAQAGTLQALELIKPYGEVSPLLAGNPCSLGTAQSRCAGFRGKAGRSA